MRARCTEVKFPRTSIYAGGSNVCSAGLAINVHSTPCQQGDRLLYTVKRKVTKMSVLNAEEQPGCDKYWLNVETSQGRGWIISSGVELCREVDLSQQFQSAASVAQPALLALPVLAAAARLAE